jgi:hypothetical protein
MESTSASITPEPSPDGWHCVNAQLKELADALSAVLRGDLNADEFRREFPMGAVAPDLERVLSNVEHFLSDADIRVRDVSYKEMQEASMARLIVALRLGDVATAGTIDFLRE